MLLKIGCNVYRLRFLQRSNAQLDRSIGVLYTSVILTLEYRVCGKRMKIAYKVWLDSSGKAFGQGPYQLLRNVERTGSLWKAAAEMGMSYSKAWRLMRNLEKRLNFTLLERHVGGAYGGGSLITRRGRNLLNRYEKFQKDVDRVLEKTYKKHFGSLK